MQVWGKIPTFISEICEKVFLSNKNYKNLLTVAGVDIVTVQGKTPNPPRCVTTRVLFLVKNWLSDFVNVFFGDPLESDESENIEKKENISSIFLLLLKASSNYIDLRLK